MSETTHRSRAVELLGYLLVSSVAGIGGAMVQSHYDDAAALKVASNIEHDRDRERQAAAEREQHLKDTIEAERNRHVDAIQKRDDHNRALTLRFVGMRRDLEAELSESRRSAESCLANAARTAAAVGAVLDSVGDVAAIAQQLDAENGRLKTDNAKLGAQVRGWQQRYEESRSRIVITGKKGT